MKLSLWDSKLNSFTIKNAVRDSVHNLKPIVFIKINLRFEVMNNSIDGQTAKKNNQIFRSNQDVPLFPISSDSQLPGLQN